MLTPFDDVEAGCVGFLVKAARNGQRTGIVDMTRGEMSTNGTVEERMQEASNAADILGVSVRENMGFQNGALYNSKETQRVIITVIRTYRPETMLIPYDHDRHPDHENASRLLRGAVSTAGLRKYETAGLEPHRPHYFFYYSLWCEFEPSFILDVPTHGI